MASRKRAGRAPAKRRFTTSQIVFYVLSFIIVLSIAIGFVIDALIPTPSRGQVVATPTPIVQVTLTPTLTPESTLTSTLVIQASPAAGEPTPPPGQ
jgi:hypothetical protein